MKLFVGLGNPGPRYADTRHNIGFMAADAIAREHGFAPFRARFQGRLAEGRLGDEKVQLLEPETYMNLSGQSVGEAMRFFRLTPADVVVFHDELDLPPGRMRVKQGGGHAGHNGLRSIIGHIGADFLRVRLGIGHPGDKDRVSDYVLSPFAKADDAWLDPLLDAMAREAAALATGDAAKFQTAVMQRLAPQPAPKPAPAKPPEAAPAATSPAEEDDPLGRLVDRFRRDLDG
jgi:PTH1 family peptidyl-tRNA hydrolase